MRSVKWIYWLKLLDFPLDAQKNTHTKTDREENYVSKKILIILNKGRQTIHKNCSKLEGNIRKMIRQHINRKRNLATTCKIYYNNIIPHAKSKQYKVLQRRIILTFLRHGCNLCPRNIIFSKCVLRVSSSNGP
jgi:hypothetical protein